MVYCVAGTTDLLVALGVWMIVDKVLPRDEVRTTGGVVMLVIVSCPVVYVVTVGTPAAGSEAGLEDAVETLLEKSMAVLCEVSNVSAKLLPTESEGTAVAVVVVCAEESGEIEAKVETGQTLRRRARRG